MEDRNYEQEARAEGWVPEEDWKGDPEKWKPAEQFVRDGEKIVPILQSKVDRLESRIKEMQETNRKFNEFSQNALAKEKSEKEKALKELEKVRQTAISEGDGETFTRADEQIHQLREELVEPTPQLDPLAQQWLDNNQWYVQDFDLQVYADGLGDRLRAMGYSGQAYFDELTKRVHERFPDQFGNKQRRRASNVESDAEPVQVSQSKTFDDLPSEAKQAYAEFKRDVPNFTKEQYLAQYEWE